MLKVTMLVEDEKRMITTTTKMAVISRSFLLSVHWAFGAIDIEDQIRRFA